MVSPVQKLPHHQENEFEELEAILCLIYFLLIIIPVAGIKRPGPEALNVPQNILLRGCFGAYRICLAHRGSPWKLLINIDL